MTTKKTVNRSYPNDTEPQSGGSTPATVRYVCHGCTKDAGHYVNPVLNARVTCPHCGMDQLTKLENFIAL